MEKICPECNGFGMVETMSPFGHTNYWDCKNCGGKGIIVVKFQISKEKSDAYLPTPWRVEDPNGNINWEASFDHAVVRMDLMASALFGKQEAA